MAAITIDLDAEIIKTVTIPKAQDAELTLEIKHAKKDESFVLRYLSSASRRQAVKTVGEKSAANLFIKECLRMALVGEGKEKPNVLDDLVSNRMAAAQRLVNLATDYQNFFDDSFWQKHKNSKGEKLVIKFFSDSEREKIASELDSDSDAEDFFARCLVACTKSDKKVDAWKDFASTRPTTTLAILQLASSFASFTKGGEEHSKNSKGSLNSA